MHLFPLRLRVFWSRVSTRLLCLKAFLLVVYIVGLLLFFGLFVGSGITGDDGDSGIESTPFSVSANPGGLEKSLFDRLEVEARDRYGDRAVDKAKLGAHDTARKMNQ